MSPRQQVSTWQWLAPGGCKLDGLGGASLDGLRGQVRLQPQSITALRLVGCPDLRALDLRAVTGLESVEIVACPGLERLLLPNDGPGIALTVRLCDAAAQLEVDGPMGQIRVCHGEQDFRRSADDHFHGPATGPYSTFDALWIVPNAHPDDPLPHCAVLLCNGEPMRYRDRNNPNRWELVLFGFRGQSLHLQQLNLPITGWLAADHFAWYAVSLVDCPGLRRVTCSARYLRILRAGRGALQVNGNAEHVRIFDSLTTHIHLDLERETRLHLKTLPILRGFSARRAVHVRVRGKIGDLVGALEELATTPGRFNHLVTMSSAESDFAAELLLRRAATVRVREDLANPDVRRALLQLAADPRDRRAAWWLALVLMGHPDRRGAGLQTDREQREPLSLAFERGQLRAARGGFGVDLLLQLYRLGPNDEPARRLISVLESGRRLEALVAVARTLLGLRRAGLDDPTLAVLINQLVGTLSIAVIERSIRNLRFGGSARFRDELEQQLGPLALVDPAACRELARRVLDHDAPNLALPLGLAMGERGIEGFRPLLARALREPFLRSPGKRRRLLELLLGNGPDPADHDRSARKLVEQPS